MHATLRSLAGITMAIGAIGTGAVLSSNSMASADSSANTATIEVVSATAGSTPFKCTFHDVTLPDTAPSAPTAPGEGIVVSSGEAHAGEVTGPSFDSAPGIMVPLGSGTITVTNDPSGSPIPAPPTAGDYVMGAASSDGPQAPLPVVINGDEVREGTADECAALDPANAPAPTGPAPTAPASTKG